MLKQTINELLGFLKDRDLFQYQRIKAFGVIDLLQK